MKFTIDHQYPALSFCRKGDYSDPIIPRIHFFGNRHISQIIFAEIIKKVVVIVMVSEIIRGKFEAF